MNELTRTIKDGKNKACVLCKHALTCSSFHKVNGHFHGREFWCKHCNSKYVFYKLGRKFLLTHVDYRLPSYNVTAYYEHPTKKQQIYAKTTILPCDRNALPFVAYDYGAMVKLQIELDFPITMEQLEEKASLYITFS